MRRERPSWASSSPPDSIYAQPTFNSPGPPPIPSTSTDTCYSYEEFRPVRIVGIANQRSFDPRIRQNLNFPERHTPRNPKSPGRTKVNRVPEEPTVPVKVTSLKKKHNRVLKWYSDLILEYPTTILMVTLLLFVGFPLSILQIYPLKLNENPEKGFDTRGTDYASKRLTWTQLQPFLLQGSRVIIHQPPPPPEEIKLIDPVSILEGRRQVENLSSITSKMNSNGRPRRTVEDIFEGLSSFVCYEIELIQMDYMSQFIIELDSYDRLFDLKFHQELCSLQSELQSKLTPFFSVSPYRSIFHISNFAGCLSPSSRDNCTTLTNTDLRNFKVLLEFCFKSRKSIIECGRDCLGTKEDFEKRKNCRECEHIPGNCSSQMWFDLFYRILPKDLMVRKSSKERIYINNFLPFYTYSSYGFQGFDVSLGHFVDFEKSLKKIAENVQNFKIKGYLLDIKRDILFDSALMDSKLAIFSSIFVFFLILFYSCSISFTFGVFVELGASVLISGAFYRFFSSEFPLLNLVTFVLLLSIGSDGAFLLFHVFPKKHQLLEEEVFYETMKHTVTTMFLAQFSTVVPFLLNLVSSVIAFRTFGLFAGMTLIFNYFLLISFLPAYLVFQRRFIDPIFEEKCCFFSTTVSRVVCFPVRKFRKFLRKLTTECLSGVLIDGRFIWICALSVVIVGTSFVTVTQLKLPQYNPLQLFTSRNPHEWYDNHAEKLFEFVSKKIALPLTVRLLWGFQVTKEVSHFDPGGITNVSQDRRFELKTKDQIRRLADDMSRFRMMDFVVETGKFWPERFLDWSRSTECSPDIAVCCNIDSEFYQDEFLDYCMRVSTSQIPTSYNDTPVYHNISFDLVGYTAMIPTRLKYSHKFRNLSSSFELFDENFVSSFTDAFFYTTEWTLMSTWFDLQRSIINDCKQSVTVSFVVVLVFSTAILRFKSLPAMISMISTVITTVGLLVMLGWEIGVLEAVILVLIVSLSFDYTLHYGAASGSEGCAEHRIHESLKKAVVPVSMAALSSTIAGGLMLFSKTHAFFQVAVFLVLSSGISLIFATFLFLPLLYLFLPKVSPSCPECDRIDKEITSRRQTNVPMHVLRGRF